MAETQRKDGEKKEKVLSFEFSWRGVSLRVDKQPQSGQGALKKLRIQRGGQQNPMKPQQALGQLCRGQIPGQNGHLIKGIISPYLFSIA